VKDHVILEHPTRGVVTDLPGHRDEKYHFSWSGLRNDERVERFYSLHEARLHRDAANAQVGGGVEIRDPARGYEVVK
jgi:hypothetical protein